MRTHMHNTRTDHRHNTHTTDLNISPYTDTKHTPHIDIPHTHHRHYTYLPCRHTTYTPQTLYITYRYHRHYIPTYTSLMHTLWYVEILIPYTTHTASLILHRPWIHTHHIYHNYICTASTTDINMPSTCTPPRHTPTDTRTHTSDSRSYQGHWVPLFTSFSGVGGPGFFRCHTDQ